MKSLGVICITVIVAFSGAWYAGVVVNISASAPAGVYRIIERDIALNDLVAVCPVNELQARYAPRGLRCSGYAPLLKKVVAQAGDLVAVNDEGVHVNLRLLPDSRPLSHDSQGRSLPRFGRRLLDSDEFFFVSTLSPGSFDSRYFGPGRAEQILGRVEPLWLF